MSTITVAAPGSPRPMTNTQLDQLSINCIRTLSMDAVQQAQSGHPNGAGAARVHAVEPRHAFRSAGPNLAEPRSVRALQWSCLHVAVVGAPPQRYPSGECRIRTAWAIRGFARRYSSLPPTRQQG